MRDFTFQGLASRVIFGRGTISLIKREAEALGCKRLLVVSTSQQTADADRTKNLLGELHVATFDGAAMHTPTDVTLNALKLVRDWSVDGVIAIGGGSSIGLSKAIALHTDLPQLVVPTTYAGSEMTPILGQTEDGVKTTQRTLRVLPETVIYDVDMTLTLPPVMSVASGINAMAHAVEALYAVDTNPVVSLMAETGIASLYKSLPKLKERPHDIDARTEALYGSWLCAICLASTSMGLHHKLCHTLGGTLNLPHAETHTAILPHALAYNASAVREAVDVISRALDGGDVSGRIYDVASRSGATVALKDLGMTEADIDVAVAAVMSKPYANPRPLDASMIKRLIANAWAGVRPDQSTYAPA
ncbi:maleylacetate reductase [Diaphorobacter sp. JS3050]|uniref:maleylacetate reductase n=1 Tax=Diaphorobacter sp. JS3050 TaxID=2735554 RepID=UPI000EB6F420|nr:maleylacetate reductase [Diaphorobacter sp. JS3050]AYE88726.1 chloromaleylacetate reductase [Diaphorobacter sp.]QJY33127.1 maleylacetate reductase [Diaphorobacter sp. JS3050]